MKKLVKLFSFLTVLMGILPLFSLHPLADSTLDHSGKLRWETDRIGKDAAEKEKLENQNYKETELEKMAPDLFKERTRAAIQTKQIEMEKATKNVEQKLFVNSSESDTSLKEREKALFSSDYTVRSTEKSNKNKLRESLMNNKMITVLFGIVVAGCAGIYGMMRKML